MKRIYILFLIITSIFAATDYHEGFHDFEIVNPDNTRNIKGGYVIVGNTVECVTTHDDDFYGQCVDNDFSVNDNVRVTKYIDIDGNASTWNSTMATIHFPSTYNQKILWAGLFWQGNVNNKWSHDPQRRAILDSNAQNGWRYVTGSRSTTLDIENTDANKILIKIGNNNYIPIEAKTLYYYKWYDDNGAVYAAYADVTEKVKNVLQQYNPGSEVNVTIANLTTNEGHEYWLGDFGGWSLVVIYGSNDLSEFKRVLIYNGYQILADSDHGDGNYDTKTITITNLYLPPQGDVDSFLAVFTGEGEEPYSPDHMKLEDQNMPGARDPDNIMDARIYGVDRPNIGYNDVSNTNGIDIDEYNVTSIMTDVRDNNPNQTSVTITLDTDWDAYFPSMVAYSTKLYVPHFCYDYSFMQNGVYITTPYIPSEFPKLPDYVKRGDDINISIYLRNTEQNDLIAKDIKFHIRDINTSKFSFQTNSVYIYKSEDGITIHLDPSEFNISSSGNDLNVTDIPFGDVNGTVYRYLYYAITPLVNELNDSVNGYFSFRLYKVINGEVIDFPVPDIALKDLPICQQNYVYEPEWSVFNVSDKGVYDIDPTKYNIPTQVTGRKGDFLVVSYDANHTDQEADYNYSVILEAINVGGFHDVNASCFNPNTPKFPLNNTLQVPVEFNGTKHVEKWLSINGAVKNAAFRVKYVNWEKFYEKLTSGCSDKSLDNTLKGIPKCLADEDNFKEAFGDNSPCLNICFSNTNANPDGFDCLRCVADIYGNKVCSRDNFSVRPDSYYITIVDPITGFSIVNNTISNPSVKLAAGVNYKVDINATTYNSINGVPGYVRYFNSNFTNDYNVSLIWSSDKNLTVCNDITNRFLTFYMINGKINLQDFNNTEVGEYNFTIQDRGWTRVDWDSSYLTHHINHSANFYQGTDCEVNSSVTLLESNITSVSSGVLTNINGCLITNKNHYTPNLNKTYKEINATYIPYKFIIDVNISYTRNKLTTFPGWIYDTDIKKYPKDENNSLRVEGNIFAVAKGNSIVKNFVNNCFAKDLNITWGYVTNNSTGKDFIYKVNENNGSREYYELNDTLVLNKNNFLKSNYGKTIISFLINYPKDNNTTILPLDLNLSDLNITANNIDDLSYEYNGTNTTARGEKIFINKQIQFRYGRLKVSNAAAYSSDINTTFEYQYWTSNGWVKNTDHTNANFGDFNHTLNIAINPYVTITNSPAINNGEQRVVFHTNHGLPYSAKVHLQINSWLWYHPLAKDYQDPSITNQDCLTHPCLKLDFLKSGSAWGGVQAISNTKFSEENRTSEMNVTHTDVNVSKSQVKKINW
ncbi:hypothetical protein [Nautilia lithotrophica]